MEEVVLAMVVTVAMEEAAAVAVVAAAMGTMVVEVAAMEAEDMTTTTEVAAVEEEEEETLGVSEFCETLQIYASLLQMDQKRFKSCRLSHFDVSNVQACRTIEFKSFWDQRK